jgi:hypothetical protein
MHSCTTRHLHCIGHITTIVVHCALLRTAQPQVRHRGSAKPQRGQALGATCIGGCTRCKGESRSRKDAGRGTGLSIAVHDSAWAAALQVQFDSLQGSGIGEALADQHTGQFLQLFACLVLVRKCRTAG